MTKSEGPVCYALYRKVIAASFDVQFLVGFYDNEKAANDAMREDHKSIGAAIQAQLALPAGTDGAVAMMGMTVGGFLESVLGISNIQHKIRKVSVKGSIVAPPSSNLVLLS